MYFNYVLLVYILAFVYESLTRLCGETMWRDYVVRLCCSAVIELLWLMVLSFSFLYLNYHESLIQKHSISYIVIVIVIVVIVIVIIVIFIVNGC